VQSALNDKTKINDAVRSILFDEQNGFLNPYIVRMHYNAGLEGRQVLKDAIDGALEKRKPINGGCP